MEIARRDRALVAAPAKKPQASDTIAYLHRRARRQDALVSFDEVNDRPPLTRRRQCRAAPILEVVFRVARMYAKGDAQLVAAHANGPEAVTGFPEVERHCEVARDRPASLGL